MELNDLPRITSNKQLYQCNDTVILKLPSEIAVGQPMFQLASLEMSRGEGSEWPANVVVNQMSSSRKDYLVPSVHNFPALLPTPDLPQSESMVYQPNFGQAYQSKSSSYKPWSQTKNNYNQNWNRSDTRNRRRFQSNKRSDFRNRPRINEANRRLHHKQIKPRNNYDINFNDVPEYSTVDNTFQSFSQNQMYEEPFQSFPNAYYNGYRGSHQGQRRY